MAGTDGVKDAIEKTQERQRAGRDEDIFGLEAAHGLHEFAIVLRLFFRDPEGQALDDAGVFGGLHRARRALLARKAERCRTGSWPAGPVEPVRFGQGTSGDGQRLSHRWKPQAQPRTIKIASDEAKAEPRPHHFFSSHVTTALSAIKPPPLPGPSALENASDSLSA